METDILIVGGGLSGLALAEQLQRRGRTWLMVEARNRLGGRILTHEFAGADFDLGPAWYWPGQPRLDQMVRRFGLTAYEQYSDGAMVVQDQSGAVETSRGFAPMRGSLRLAGGMGVLVQALAAELPADRLHLNRPLSRLEKAAVGISATAGLDRIKARHVVLAIPPRVAAETVSFVPALSEEATEAMHSIPTWMAGQAKILAIYEKPHWREAGLSGDAVSQCGPMMEIHDASPIRGGPFGLFGFVGYPPGIRAEHPDRLLELARQQLVAMFGANMTRPLALRMQDWAQMPETATRRDLVSPPFHPAYGLPRALTNLWSGDLMLGATETARGFGGFLEGALEAADTITGILESTPQVAAP